MGSLRRSILLLLVVGLFATVAAAQIPVGFISYDYIGSGLAEFDVVNQTGPNSSPYPDETWPVTNSINLSSLSLAVYFADGTEMTYGSGYFTLEPDGLSWTGPQLPTGDSITMAVLTGDFNPVEFMLNDGTQKTVDPTFTATISDPNNLQNGDYAIIYGNPVGGSVPEPGTLVLMGSGALGLIGVRRRKLAGDLRRWFGNRTFIVLLVFGLMLAPAAYRASATNTLHNNLWVSPSQGFAGTGQVNIAGSGFPSGTIFAGDITVSLWAPGTCQTGTPVATTTGLLFVRLIGTGGRVQFLIPSSITTSGTYSVSISDTTSGQQFTSANCSLVKVLETVQVSSCVPGASMGVLRNGTNVTAYVPNGAWSIGNTGIKVIPVEGGGSSTTIPTANVPNSCSSNSSTGQTVCVANNTDVYLITGTTLTGTLTSGATGTLGFSGGECVNCGVAIDQSNNRAVITVGLSSSPSGGGFQALDLTSDTFATPVASFYEPSEDIQLDPGRNLLLSPNEANIYDLFDTSGATWKEYGDAVSGLPGVFDSAAEDCTTGIALSSEEDGNSVYITDLTQAVFVSGSPGSWSAPGQSTLFPEFANMAFSTDGLAVAPGSHLAIVTGEFGSNEIGVVTLPSTSGSGTPAFGDYVAAYLPNTPDGNGFSLGFDPHTVTAYASPSGGYFGLAADWVTGVPTYVAVIDLQGLLSAPRCNGNCQLGPHEVDPTYDLIAHGIVRYVH